jgi:hypothetical protein
MKNPASDWQTRTVAPPRDAPPKVDIRNPSPGLCRPMGMILFLAAGFGCYYGGLSVLGLTPLNWAAPAWTGKHVLLVTVSMLLACIAGVIGQGAALLIDVSSDRANDFFITIWQFFANGTMLWLLIVGTAMSIALGREEAKDAVIRYGAEQSTLLVVGVGGVTSLFVALLHFATRVLRLPALIFLVTSLAAIFMAARWHLAIYGIHGNWWIGVGIVFLVLLIPSALSMMARDHQQRNIVREQLKNETVRT